MTPLRGCSGAHRRSDIHEAQSAPTARCPVCRVGRTVCIFIGDAARDVQAGKAADVATIGYANKPGKEAALAAAGAVAVTDSMSAIAEAFGDPCQLGATVITRAGGASVGRGHGEPSKCQFRRHSGSGL